MERLQKLHECGQSYWLDNLTRRMLDSGELTRRVDSEGLRGMTSNPKTFSKAISGGSEYDEQFRELVAGRAEVDHIYEQLAVTDVQRACDVFRAVYDTSDGKDGFVSLEVSPHLARDTDATLREARRLFHAVDRPNVLIKIPGTIEGLDAIEQMLYEGVNINITLLFSIPRYRAVAERHLRALERRVGEGEPVDRICSVASFFLSRIDVLADRLLGHRIPAGGKLPPDRRPESLQGELAIASAKLAYQSFRSMIDGDRWRALAKEGASVQRLLWASTSTKNPLYSDVKYVEPLIGPDTVNTMPRDTIDAFADHGRVRPGTIEENLEDAHEIFARVKALGLDVDVLAAQLEDEGIEKFRSPYDQLMKTLAERRRDSRGGARQTITAGPLEDHLTATHEALDEMQVGRRLFSGDPYLWSDERAQASEIRERLGWLDCAREFRDRLDDIERFANDVRESFDRVALLGMGGSSLASDVCREIFGSAPGFPELRVLDSTDPEMVAAIERWVANERALFLVASKSGTTTETMSFYRHFYDLLDRDGARDTGKRFAAITDPGTPLAEEGRERGFRWIFENPPGIGGRYSALSYFGLVPMALMGLDVDAVLARAAEQATDSGPPVPSEANPAVSLGALFGIAARQGRDRITFVPGSPVDAFARWAEQLLAESTGKDGRGLIPVVDEPLGGVDAYSNDRVFVNLSTPSPVESAPAARLRALEKEGHPVARIEIDDPVELGGEFFRFEVATAVAGKILGINPFDEPNVVESKHATRELLDEWESRGRFEQEDALSRGERITIRADASQDWLQELKRNQPLANFLESFLSLATPHDYLCLLPYLPFSEERHRRLRSLRLALRDRLRLATTLGYGPRYLHSTGQLHKGGPDRGLFFFITAESEDARAIPGEKYGFATLERAQSLGDLRALHRRGRRAILIELGRDIDAGLDELASTLIDEAHLVRVT